MIAISSSTKAPGSHKFRPGVRSHGEFRGVISGVLLLCPSVFQDSVRGGHQRAASTYSRPQ